MDKPNLEKIRMLRAKHKLSGREVAEKLGVTVSTYYKYENGCTDIPLTKAKGIADIYGEKVDDIFFTN